MKKFIMINGVKTYIEEEPEAPTGGDAPPAGDPPAPAADPTPDLDAQAKAFGQAVAKEVATVLNLDAKKQPEYGTKMAQLLKGKDLTDKNALTAEEKIVAFYHALVTKDLSVCKALSEGTAADGGYLFPDEFRAELIKSLTGPYTMRGLVRTVPMSRDVMKIPTLGSRPKVYWTSENATKTTTTADFSEATLTVYKMAAIIYSSDELIEDSTEIDVVRTIIDLFADQIKDEEDRVILQGTGTGQPTGLVTAVAATTIASRACAGNLDVDDIIDVIYDLPQPYHANAKFIVSRENARELRKSKDSNGQYLWQPNVQADQPPLLAGYPVIINDYVGNATILFGDFKLTYWLGDRKQMTVKISQDTETAFTKDQTAIRVVERIAGNVVLADACRAIASIP